MADEFSEWLELVKIASIRVMDGFEFLASGQAKNYFLGTFSAICGPESCCDELLQSLFL